MGERHVCVTRHSLVAMLCGGSIDSFVWRVVTYKVTFIYALPVATEKNIFSSRPGEKRNNNIKGGATAILYVHKQGRKLQLFEVYWSVRVIIIKKHTKKNKGKWRANKS